MRHRATPKFWRHYNALPADIQELARGCFALMKQNLRHPSLHLKKAGRFWSARVGLHHRTVAIEKDEDLVWFWIGPHAEYEALLTRR
ncbi:MAG: hypothetical protein NTW86_30775 [Candidatus Sumerlaeota bacterium]|nr:hypothetical protein [Candidatus Sumerlaeota bacterium]